MNDLPSRFHRLKLVLVSVILTIGGAVLIAIGNRTSNSSGLMGLIPWAEIGGIIIGAGLLSIWIDHVVRSDQQAADDARLRTIMKDQAPVMRDAVLDAFAANHEDLQRVATPETLDRIIETSLGLRLNDPKFAGEMYADFRQQAIEAPERWHDASVSIDLSPVTALKGQPRNFEVTVRWEYTAIAKHTQRRFACVSDQHEYEELARSGSDTSAWFLRPGTGHTASDREAFELLQFAIDGEEQKIRRSTRKDFQLYTIDLATHIEATDKPATFSYTYRTLTRQSGHLLFFDIEQPTRDIKMTFDYTGTGIEQITAIAQMPSVRGTRTEHSPKTVTPQTIRVETDGWTFPRSGVAFVWTLDSEKR